MAGNGLPQHVRRRMYSFARTVARPFSDSRRVGFVEDMIPGLIISGHVHLSKIARAVYAGDTKIHGVEKSLSRHLGSEHWDMSPVDDFLLRRSAALVYENTLIVADLADLSKPWAKKLDGLGRVHDGSDPILEVAQGGHLCLRLDCITNTPITASPPYYEPSEELIVGELPYPDWSSSSGSSFKMRSTCSMSASLTPSRRR